MKGFIDKIGVFDFWAIFVPGSVMLYGTLCLCTDCFMNHIYSITVDSSLPHITIIELGEIDYSLWSIGAFIICAYILGSFLNIVMDIMWRVSRLRNNSWLIKVGYKVLCRKNPAIYPSCIIDQLSSFKDWEQKYYVVYSKLSELNISTPISILEHQSALLRNMILPSIVMTYVIISSLGMINKYWILAIVALVALLFLIGAVERQIKTYSVAFDYYVYNKENIDIMKTEMSKSKEAQHPQKKQRKITMFFYKLFCGIDIPKRYIGSALKQQRELITNIWNQTEYLDFGLERMVRLFCALSIYLFPTLYIREWSGKMGWLGRKLAMDAYTVINFLVPIIILWAHWYTIPWVVWICVYLFLSTLSYAINLIILSPEFTQPGSYLRSVLSLLINFVQIILCFAVFYLHWGTLAGENVLSLLDAIYYSAIVSTTLGLGEVILDTSVVKIITIMQSLISLVFVYLILTNFISHIEERTYGNRKHGNKDDERKDRLKKSICEIIDKSFS